MIIPTTVFAFLLLIASICSAQPSISEFLMKILAVRHSCAFSHSSEYFLATQLSICVFITVLHIPVASSGPVKTSFLACLASLSAISFLFIPVWPDSEKMVSGRLSASRFKFRYQSYTNLDVVVYAPRASMALLLSVPICNPYTRFHE